MSNNAVIYIPRKYSEHRHALRSEYVAKYPKTGTARILWLEAWRGEVEACDRVAVFGASAEVLADIETVYDAKDVEVEVFDIPKSVTAGDKPKRGRKDGRKAAEANADTSEGDGDGTGDGDTE